MKENQVVENESVKESLGEICLRLRKKGLESVLPSEGLAGDYDTT
jgi:hypothetical protein